MSESKVPVERLCWFCKHFSFGLGEPYSPCYSTYTPGSPGEPGHMECAEKIWEVDTYSTQSQLNAALVHARTCGLFEPSAEAIALFNTPESKG